MLRVSEKNLYYRTLAKPNMMLLDWSVPLLVLMSICHVPTASGKCCLVDKIKVERKFQINKVTPAREGNDLFLENL